MSKIIRIRRQVIRLRRHRRDSWWVRANRILDYGSEAFAWLIGFIALAVLFGASLRMG